MALLSCVEKEGCEGGLGERVGEKGGVRGGVEGWI